MVLNIAKIYDAAKVLSQIARKTDLILSKTMLEGSEIYLKSENIQ